MGEPFELKGELRPPALPGTVTVRADLEDVLEAAAADLYAQAVACVGSFGDFHLALSPHEHVERLVVRLMVDPKFRGLPWSRSHVWLTDDRLRDDGRGWAGLEELVVEGAGMPAGQVHPISVQHEAADIEYEQAIRDALGWRERGHDRLDAVVLGLGPDGSLGAHGTGPGVGSGAGPGDGPGDRADRLVVRGSGGPVSMTLTMLNASRLIQVIAAGGALAGAIGAVARGADRPASRLRPVGGALRWYVDEDAASAPEPSGGGGA